MIAKTEIGLQLEAMNEKIPLARLRALIAGWFDFVANRTMPGGCFMNAVSSEYRARPGRIRDVEQLVFDLIANEAAGNVAALMGDTQEFNRPRST